MKFCRAEIIVFSFCSAALTASDPSFPSFTVLCSSLFHPHKSLMMCRLQRAGLSNDIITISKNLLLSYGPTSCGMLYRAGRCLPQTEPSPQIFLSKRQAATVCYAFLSLPVVCWFNLGKGVDAVCTAEASEDTITLNKRQTLRRTWFSFDYLLPKKARRGPHNAGGYLSAPPAWGFFI